MSTFGPLGWGVYGNYSSMDDPVFDEDLIVDWDMLAYFISTPPPAQFAAQLVVVEPIDAGISTPPRTSR